MIFGDVKLKVLKQTTGVCSVSEILLGRKDGSVECCFSTQPEAAEQHLGYHLLCFDVYVPDLGIT